MTTKLNIAFATALVITLASPAFADQPESLVNDPANVVTTQPREKALILQATPGPHHRGQAVGAPRHQLTDDIWFDRAKGSIW